MRWPAATTNNHVPAHRWTSFDNRRDNEDTNQDRSFRVCERRAHRLSVIRRRRDVFAVLSVVPPRVVDHAVPVVSAVLHRLHRRICHHQREYTKQNTKTRGKRNYYLYLGSCFDIVRNFFFFFLWFSPPPFSGEDHTDDVKIADISRSSGTSVAVVRPPPPARPTDQLFYTNTVRVPCTQRPPISMVIY